MQRVDWFTWMFSEIDIGELERVICFTCESTRLGWVQETFLETQGKDID